MEHNNNNNPLPSLPAHPAPFNILLNDLHLLNDPATSFPPLYPFDTPSAPLFQLPPSPHSQPSLASAPASSSAPAPVTTPEQQEHQEQEMHMLEEQQQQLETIMTQISSFPSNTNTNTTTNHETVSNMTAFNDNNTNTDFLVPAAVDNITDVTNNNNNEQLMLSQLSLSVPMPASSSIPMEDDSDTETTTTTNTITDHRHRHPHNHSHHHNIPSHITLQDQLKSSSASSSSTQLTAPTVPANPGDLTCKVCGRVYSRRDNLLAHQRVHTGAKPYECNTCGKRFRWQSALRNHEGAHKRRGTFPVRRGRIRKVHVIATLAASIAQGEMQNEVQQENVDDVDMEQQQQQQQQTEDRGQGEESMSEVQECIEQAFERDDPVDWISTFIVQPGITLQQQQQQQQQRMITPRTDNIMP